MSKLASLILLPVLVLGVFAMLGQHGATQAATIFTSSARVVQSTAEPTTDSTTADNFTEQELTFTVDNLTIYGTLTLPNGASPDHKVPAMLLLSGSGPTDRDGNSNILSGKIDSHKFFARVLANAGVASFRYDKFASGKTGVGDFASHLDDVDFELFINETIAAFNLLKGREEVDPTQVGVLGHSEGGLIALVVADRLKNGKEPGVKALILAAPLSKPYLTTLREQIQAQYDAAVKSGAYTQSQADKGMKELDNIIASLIKDGTVPDKISATFQALFNKANLKFLAQANQNDPAKIAEGLPSTLPVLVMCGEKDSQVLCNDVEYLMEGFKKADNTNAEFYRLANVIHVFKVVEGMPFGIADYTNPKLPFSLEAEKLVTDFVQKVFTTK
jgi:uncharacterized protein